jgi:transposase-like protein/IS1 family transposase
VTCHNCKTACGRYGRDRYGHQRYRCNQCRKTFQDARDKPLDGMYLPLDKAERVLSLMVEGCSIRSIERLTDINRDTIMRLLGVAGAKCERLLSDRVRGLDVSDVECDEIWGFVWCKEKRKPTDSPFIGDAWCYVAMERTNKLILAWHLGRRNAEHTLEFTEKLRVATTGRFQITTDGWGPYPDSIKYSLGTRVDFAKLIKVYRSGTQGEGRYSPAEIVSTEVVPVMGRPNRKRICTSHIERQNLSIRMGMRRMTRLTNGFSKKWQNLRAAYACWFAFFNFCRVHKTLRVTPAMEAGITDHIWSVRELLECKLA